MTFLSPLVLIGLFGALVPLIIHLLFRKKPQLRTLPTLMFVRLANQKVLRRHRIRRWLLLALRMLLIALAAVAMSRPLIQSAQTSGLETSTKDTVIVIDNSYFMMIDVDGETLYQHIRRKASAIISGVQGRVSVVLACSEENTPPTLSVDKTEVQNYLSGSAVVPEVCDLAKAVSLAEQMLRLPAPDADGARMLVFSSGKRLGELVLAHDESNGVQVDTRDVFAGLKLENSFISGVSLSSAPELGEDYWQVDVTMGHSGESTRQTELILNVPGVARLVSPVLLKPNEMTVETFNFVYSGASPGAAEARLMADKLEYDDRYPFWIQPERQISVFAINGEFNERPQDDELFYAAAALSSKTTRTQAFSFRSQPAEAWLPGNLGDVDVVLLANPGRLPAGLSAQLTNFVTAGGGLVITMGDRVQPERLNDELGHLMPLKLRGIRKAGDAAATDLGKDRKLARLLNFKGNHSILNLVPEPSETSISNASVSKYALFLNEPIRGAEEVIHLDEGAPLLTTRDFKNGRVAMLGTTIDREWTDLPIQPDFLPFLHGLIRYAADVEAAESPHFIQGKVVDVDLPEQVGMSFTYQMDQRPERRIDASHYDGNRYHLDGLKNIGHYRLRPEKNDEYPALNFAIVPNTRHSQFENGTTKSESGVVNAQLSGSAGRQALWPYIFGALIFIFFMESHLAYRRRRGMQA